MKKSYKIALITCATILGIGLLTSAIAIPIIAIGNLLSKQNHSNQENIGKKLTSQEVQKNFNQGGIWYQKTFLTGEDFVNYDGGLTTDCFNNLTYVLEYVELYDTTWINPDDLGNKNIYWPKIKIIKIKETDSTSKNIFQCNNILFYATGNLTYCATTIIDRINNITISFPNKNELPVNRLLEISNDFYKDDIFKNVSKININSDSVIYIGKNAFSNCQKLYEFLFLDLRDRKPSAVIIESNAFTNTNLLAVSINAPLGIDIGENAFYNCSSLKWTCLTSDIAVILQKNSFKQCNVDFTSIINSCGLEVYDYAFENQYNNFVFSITTFFLWTGYKFSLNAFSNINITDINNFQFYVYNKELTTKDIFINTGLTQEQIDKIQIDNGN